MLILDTNVVSELMRPSPNPAVLRWMERQESVQMFTTTVTQAEILLGVALMDEGRRRTQLGERAAQMFAIDFARRVLPFDGPAATAYAHIVAERRRGGRPIALLDAEIAAIAQSVAAGLVTRNVRDFEHLSLTLHNPWDA